MKTLSNRTLGVLGVAAIFIALIANTGCLKTRAQLKEDPQEETGPTSKGFPAKVQDVQPQGEYVIDEIKSEITRLSGRVEDMERAQKAASESPSKQEEIKKLEQRIVELEQAQAQMIEALKKMQQGGATPTAADATEHCEKGQKSFASGSFEDAVEHFTACLKNPKGKTQAAKATFMRAEAYYKLKNYKKAIVDYSKFPEKFTTSSFMSSALYKIGLSFESLGMKEDAKGFYQELVEKFPKSQEAKKAKAKLK